MGAIKGLLASLTSSAFGIIFLAAGTLGWAYWMWMSIILGKFGMFFFGILGPFALVAGFLGLWSFFFGIPHWLL
ncbi:cell division protein FtsX [Bradyrhizobium sp. USDA 4341]